VKKVRQEKLKFQDTVEVSDLFHYQPAMHTSGLPRVDLVILPMDEDKCPPGIEQARDIEHELHGTKCLVCFIA
jgi:hypothetical protein